MFAPSFYDILLFGNAKHFISTQTFPSELQ